MSTRSMASETTSLLKLVEQRIQLKRELEENKKKQHKNKEPQDSLVAVPYIPKDCIFNIIVRLPLESLQTSRFVCKSWYGIINSPVFIDAHLRRSDIGLIFLTPARKGLPSCDVGKASGSSTMKLDFSVEAKVSELQSHWNLFDLPLLSRIKFIEIKDGNSTIKEYNITCKGQIRAACNGLIILEHSMKKGGLIVLNPVTRKLKTIPFGTRRPHHRESYGLAFCHESGIYKLVHLFQDELQYVGCEIIYIGSGSWRVADGPPHGLFGWLGYKPIFAIGALHWVPHVDHNEYIMSMPLNEEKFVKIPLPQSGGIHDRILEMGGFLGFVARQSAYQIDVWILRSLGGEGWSKQLSITVDFTRNMVPLYCMRFDGEIVFKCEDNDLYAYDHGMQVMRKIEVNKECFSSKGCCFPHVNSLVQWKI